MSEQGLSKKINYQRPLGKRKIIENPYDIIRQFESDRGRIINSAAIRRLQQKTQVFPLERNAAVRSRLTHSMEVQQVGRYIVKEIAAKWQRDSSSCPIKIEEWVAIESIVEMACLMHDIGNPPFGHFGEAAINNWFRQYLHPDYCDAKEGADSCILPILRLQEGEETLNSLRCRIRRDLSHFEGNAQALRLVHTLQKLNLTYAQVACIIKYTKPAYWVAEIPDGYDYLMKKAGYYLSEEEFVQKLWRELQMEQYSRYPFTYIMEAADDISYCLADLEDAVEKEILTVRQLYGLLLKEWGKRQAGDLFDCTVGKAHRLMQEGSNRRSASDHFFMYLRVNTVACLVPHAVQQFITHFAAIQEGTFNSALLEDGSEQNKLLHIFKRVAQKHVFNYSEVELLELQGNRVISGLLEIYSPLLKMPIADFRRLVREDELSSAAIETRLWHKLSTKHRLAYEEATTDLQKYQHDEVIPDELAIWEIYYRARLLQDYISGMTDLYAYEEYRRLMVAE